VKRKHIYEMFKDLVEGMYRDTQEAWSEGKETNGRLATG